MQCLDTAAQRAERRACALDAGGMPLPEDVPPTMAAEEFEWENAEKSLSVQAFRPYKARDTAS